MCECKEGEALKRDNEVTVFLDAITAAKRSEIDYLRDLILSCAAELEETVKWNAPNYKYQSEDRLTMRITSSKVQLVFHRGAKEKDLPAEHLIQDEFGLLEWKTNDRAVIALSNIEDIKRHEMQLIELIKRWLNAA